MAIKIILEVTTVQDAKDGIKYLEDFIKTNNKTITDQPKVDKTITDQPKVDKTVIKQPKVDKTVCTSNAPESFTKLDDVNTDQVSIDSLTALAKSKVKEFDRATVKAVISKYGVSISKVDVNDYNKLYKDLSDLS